MVWWKLLARKISTYGSLSARSRCTFFLALFGLPLIALSLHRLGFRRTQTLLHLIPTVSTASEGCLPTAEMVKIAARYTQPWATCLPQALVLQTLLRRQGIPSTLRIGVRRAADQLEAHAWVEAEGKALNEGGDVYEQYQVFEREIPAQLL